MSGEASTPSSVPPKRKAGRPKGAHDKQPRAKRRRVVDETQADEGEEMQAEPEEKRTKPEDVEFLFAQLNKGVVPAQVVLYSNRCVTYRNASEVVGDYEEFALSGVDANNEEFCQPLSEFMDTMASVSKCWRVVHGDWMNKMLPCGKNTGPCIQLVRRDDQPNLPEDFRDLAYLVSCVNSLPNIDGCAVPTEFTRLKWSANFDHILGVKHLHADAGERFLQKEAVMQQERRTFMGAELPHPDSLAYMEPDGSSEELFVTCDTLVLIVNVVPVIYSLEGKTLSTTFWVATVLPQPGVDVLRCFEKTGRPLGNTGPDLKLAAERRNKWRRLNYNEPFVAYNMTVQEWDHVFSGSAADNLEDRRHPYTTMNPTALLHKIAHMLPDGVERCRIIGPPFVRSSDDLKMAYACHVRSRRMYISWGREFERLSEAVMQLRPLGARRHIPPLNLPVAAGFPLCDPDTGTVYYNIVGQPPLALLWKPMLQFDLRAPFADFSVGRLPQLAQGALVAWIFDGDVKEFIGEDHPAMTEDRIFERYYRDNSSVLDDYVRSGCLSHWRDSVMKNIAEILRRCVLEAQLGPELEALRELGREDEFNEDEAHRRDVAHHREKLRLAMEAEAAAERAAEAAEEDGEKIEEVNDEDEEKEEEAEEKEEEAEEKEEEAEEEGGARYVDAEAEGSGSSDSDEDGSEWSKVTSGSGGEVPGEQRLVPDEAFARRPSERRPSGPRLSEREASEASEREASEAPDARAALERALLKLRNYMKTAWRWSGAMMDGGLFESDFVKNMQAILKAHIATLNADMRAFAAAFGDPDTVPVTSVMAGCFAFQNAVLHINSVANMNAPNLTTFRELFTTAVGSYLGSSNATWACFFWPVQVAVGFGNFMFVAKDGNVPYCVKPNSSGMDSVLVPTLMHCRKLFQVRMKTTEVLAQCMVQIPRGTPKALENVGRIEIDQHHVLQRPSNSMRMQMLLMTELRHVDEAKWNTFVNGLPRHDNSTQTENKVLSTDVSAAAGGARRGTESVRIESMKLLLCGTNVVAQNLREGECLQSLRSTMVLMPPGGCVDEGRPDRSRKIGEVHHDASKGECRFFTSDDERARLCPGMCIAPLLATSLAIMHDVGLVHVEVSEMVGDLYTWFFWILETHFKWTVAAPLSNSIQRLQGGWKARGVADTLLYRIIGRFSRDEKTVDAVCNTLLGSAYDAHAMFLVPTQVHQNLRGVIDGQVILVNRFIVSALNVPTVPFSWLVDVFTGRVRVETAGDGFGAVVHRWLLGLVHGSNFVPQDTRVPRCSRTNVSPYISTPGSDAGAPLNDADTLLRFHVGGTQPTWLNVAQHFARSASADMARISMGIPAEGAAGVYRNALHEYAKTVVEVGMLFNSFDIFDINKVMLVFGVREVPGAFLQSGNLHRHGVFELARLLTLGQDNARYAVVAVHCVAVLVVTSLLSTNSEGMFHNNQASNAARNVMQAVCAHAPVSAIPGDGNTVLLKNFSFAQGTPRATYLRVRVEETLDRDYFLRPKYDARMQRSCRLGYLEGRFKRYMFEDTVHLHGLLSFLHKQNIDPDNLTRIPVQLLAPEYEIVAGRTYPLVRCSGDFEGSVRVDGVARIVAREGGVETSEEVPLAELSAALCRLNVIVYPLVHRRNAVVRTERGCGVLLPDYLDPVALTYTVRWADGETSTVHFRELDDILLGVGSHVFVRLASAAFAPFRAGIREADGVVRANLFYPNGEFAAERDFSVAYVNVPMRRRVNGVVHKGASEVLKVPLADLADPAGEHVIELLSVGV